MTKKLKERNLNIQTKFIHDGSLRSQNNETSEAIYLTSGYVYSSAEEAEARFNGEIDGYIYSRYSNPNLSMLQKKLCEMEGAQAARLTASGMAAVFWSLFTNVQSGDHIVGADAIFGSCLSILKDILPNYGIEVTIVRATNIEAWKKAIKKNTKVFFFETPTNPMLEILDIEAISNIAKENEIKVIIDNVFATPLRQRPLELGADIVIYSATKHIDGQGRCLGGVILGEAEFIENKLHDYLKHTGPALSPFNAWVMMKGLETLGVRTDRQIENANLIAEYLKTLSGVSQVIYPGHKDHPQFEITQKQMSGGGPLVTFKIKGGKEEAFSFLNKLEIIKISNNLGDTKSLITHPSTTTHRSVSDEDKAVLGITDNTLRLSVGLEDISDIIDDLNFAISVVK
jgi:O-succinylhomoserine sulfhydrylase